MLIGPVVLYSLFDLQFFRNRWIHALMRKALGYGCLSSRLSKASWVDSLTAKTSRFTLASAITSVVGYVITSGGQFDGSDSEVGPCFHRTLFSAFPPLLPISAGFSSVGT